MSSGTKITKQYFSSTSLIERGPQGNLGRVHIHFDGLIFLLLGFWSPGLLVRRGFVVTFGHDPSVMPLRPLRRVEAISHSAFHAHLRPTTFYHSIKRETSMSLFDPDESSTQIFLNLISLLVCGFVLWTVLMVLWEIFGVIFLGHHLSISTEAYPSCCP